MPRGGGGNRTGLDGEDSVEQVCSSLREKEERLKVYIIDVIDTLVCYLRYMYEYDWKLS